MTGLTWLDNILSLYFMFYVGINNRWCPAVNIQATNVYLSLASACLADFLENCQIRTTDQVILRYEPWNVTTKLSVN